MIAGTWTSSIRPQSMVTPAAVTAAVATAAVPSNATLVSTAAIDPTGNASVEISSLKHSKPHKGKADAGGYDPDGPLLPRRRTGFKPVWGDDGLWMSESGVIPADATVAAGPRQVLHVVNSLVKILPIDAGRGVPDPPNGYGAGGYHGGEAVVVTLPDFFGLVASNCDGGYITPSAVFDKQVKRFVVTAVCGGEANQILLAVSQTPDALGGWWLYSFPGYSTYDTAMACFNGDIHLTPTSVHTQVGYNRDGVYISFVQNCPLCEVSQATGSVLYALPKWAVYSGTTQAVVGPVYTGRTATVCCFDVWVLSSCCSTARDFNAWLV